ncbi:uncharacterized protein ColSpa_10701 [Colletotrichum spaethianum]|uniref:Lumazine-binding protein n=1 Tax=Colletotrichum spaethianum TaxID=700344 RepID=A0AA37UPF6_9PEZI|nr:uncharacterized protein ColSpa_10701 [Colletotrichum spaethianum]GKT50520.1 hypothetical protein ColSpa_10701 [Colletotrichum spaethianum]
MSKNVKAVPTSDYFAVVEVVENYVAGLKVGDAKQVAKSFHKDATMYGFSAEGELLGGPISNLWTFMEQFGAAPNIIARNDIISITPTTAVVKVDMENDAAGNDYTDNHTLLKQDGKWLIIAKVFHTYQK